MQTDPIYLAHCFNIAIALLALVGVVRFLLVPHLHDEGGVARRSPPRPAGTRDGTPLNELQKALRTAARVCQVQVVYSEDPQVVTVILRANRRDLGYLFRRKAGETSNDAGSVAGSQAVSSAERNCPSAPAATPSPHDTAQ